MIEREKKVVAVGMSGGVDSTMAALMLKQEGFKVIGLTMSLWDDSLKVKTSKSGCYGPNEVEDIDSARRAAQKLDIRHYVIDLRKPYQELVIENFRAEYLKGKTPNPCVICNAKIKFGTLLEKALSSGIDFDLFATGHYARVEYDPLNKRYSLKRGMDETKDQSYFLYRLSQDQLSRILFPLGLYRKNDIKALAEEAGFSEMLNRPESQDFFECDDYGPLLKTPDNQGKILDLNRKVIGEHRGIAHYTVGQRKMLNLSGLKEPFYVLAIDAGRNEITAGPKKDLLQDQLIAEQLHWVVPFPSIPKRKLQAQIRYRSKPAECLLFPGEDQTIKVEFASPQEAITPGQSIVFFDDDTVLGGGIIRSALRG
jgi:tRNA-specific 2-thiouridylase